MNSPSSLSRYSAVAGFGSAPDERTPLPTTDPTMTAASTATGQVFIRISSSKQARFYPIAIRDHEHSPPDAFLLNYLSSYGGTPRSASVFACTSIQRRE